MVLRCGVCRGWFLISVRPLFTQSRRSQRKLLPETVDDIGRELVAVVSIHPLVLSISDSLLATTFESGRRSDVRRLLL